MKFHFRWAVTALFITALGASSVSNAALVDQGGGLIYDTDRNITWLANGNLAASNTFGLATGVDLGPIPGVTTLGGSYIYSDGNMTWGGALKWISAMNASNYLGFNDWRLPATMQPDATCSIQYNGDPTGLNCTGSEMGHLFYQELGGVAGQDILFAHNTNYSLFQNLMSGDYWSGTEFYLGTGNAFTFANYDGSQTGYSSENLFAAIAVRGQAATPTVPVPTAVWLFGSGLLSLMGFARPSQKSLNR